MLREMLEWQNNISIEQRYDVVLIERKANCYNEPRNIIAPIFLLKNLFALNNDRNQLSE